ncbi:MAG: MerR family transcriptional regulator [Chloroflexi bacterium]|nr:MerR family transcriptional regulator [Chloroflexota bacterium]
MTQDEYSIDQLANLTGFTRRNIRSYVQQGLIDPPDSVGRKARYGRKHLVVLQAIRTLREGHNLALADIRARLLFADPQEVEDLAAQTGEIGSSPAPDSDGVGRSALEYLESLKRSPGQLREVSSQMAMDDGGIEGQHLHRRMIQSGTAPPARSSPVDRLLRNIERLGDGKPIARKSKGEQWVRIPVTPDIEISVRGANSPEQVARLEAIADRLRVLLMEEEEYDEGK